MSPAKNDSLQATLCFVLMPFGRKGADGVEIDFDRVYQDILAPAIRAAGLHAIRADEEVAGGIIHKPMFERLVLCEYAVGDLTTANANVFYELGVRHAARPASTLLVFAEGLGRLPFDVGPLRALPYAVGADGVPSRAARDRDAIAARLRELRASERLVDSPLYQLLNDYPNVSHEKTDVFRDRVRIAENLRAKLRRARETKPLTAAAKELNSIEVSLGRLAETDSAVVIDLFLSYRDAEAYGDMIRLARAMPGVLAETVLVQEQLAFALNRAGQGEEAERVLQRLIERRGGSSETYGLLGRVHKDRWERARAAGKTALAGALLQQAIDSYLKGFEADWRDPFPGVNALTLMEINDPRDPRMQEILPVLEYSVQRRRARPSADYWDHATALEIAALARDERAARAALALVLSSARVGWHLATTLRNLKLIQFAREARGQAAPWHTEIVAALEEAWSDLAPKEVP